MTSESVTCGHPDKLADLIADSILDACLEQDPNSRVACEVMLTGNNVIIAGEVTTEAVVDYENEALAIIAQVGYKTDNLKVQVLIQEQSEDISQAVNGEELGAGDQGLMFGYATNETENFMPLGVEIANQLTSKLTECREKGIIEGLLPDGKSQVTISCKNDKPFAVETVIVSAQHEEWKDVEILEEEIENFVVKPILQNCDIASGAIVIVNPSGRFVKGGFEADTGLTGRKIVADSYGGYVHHGGGAFSGKDASKVDRSGAYMARYVAKNIVSAGLADKVLVGLSYVIGKSTPMSIDITTFGTNKVSESNIRERALEVFSFKVQDIVDKLHLTRPIFSMTTVGGHFGKEHLAWEATDKIQEMRKYVELL